LGVVELSVNAENVGVENAGVDNVQARSDRGGKPGNGQGGSGNTGQINLTKNTVCRSAMHMVMGTKHSDVCSLEN